MSEDEYYGWYQKHGFRRTGEGTKITEEWERADGTTIYVTRASELTPVDRARKVDYLARTLAIGYPIAGGGVH